MVHVHHNPHRDDDVETEVALEEQEDMNNMLSIGNHHMTAASSVFLHTIPEDSSNIGGQDSSSLAFNPSGVAPLGGLSPTSSTSASAGGGSISSTSSPWAMMKKFRSSGQAGASSRSGPQSPASVTSSTNAVQAGHIMGFDALDGSNTAVRAGDEESTVNRPSSTTFGTTAYETDPTGIAAKKKRRQSIVTRKKVGVVAGFAALLILAVVIALVLIVVSINEGGDESDTVAQTNASSLSLADDEIPTLAPSEAGTMWGRVFDDDDVAGVTGTTEDDSVLVHLEEAIVMLYSTNNKLASVSGHVFSEATDARYQARSWMLNNDTYLASVVAESAPEDRDVLLQHIAQRYIMTVFYFSTHVDEIINDTADDNNNNRRRQNRQRKILSQGGTSEFEIQPDVHECYWLVNACGQDDAASAASAASQGDTTAVITSAPEESISMDASVVYVNASDCDLIGTIPFELEYLTDLEKLIIQNNGQLRGTIPEQIANQWQELYLLDLSANSLEGSIPLSIWTLPKLRYAYLNENRFEGTIPCSLATVSSLTASPNQPLTLEKIWLKNNQLSGEIPGWWAEDLPALKELSVGNNSFTGPLPLNWSQATSVGFVDASFNQLTGSVPYSLLYGVPSLRRLYLDDNELSGGLVVSSSTELQNELGLDFTVSFTRASSLMEALWLQNNRLTGTIPRGFGWDWEKLRELELQNNQLAGIWECMDDDNKVWPELEDLSIDCFQSSILTAGSTEPSVTSEASGGAGGGVDISMCNACCIRCF